MKELTTENIEKSLEALIGSKPDSFLIVVRAQGQTALCAAGNHVDNPMPIAMDWDGNEKVLVAGVPKRDFEALWRGLYPEGQKSWGANPWVWVIDFDVVKRQ